jgi:hypothetical protein
MLFADALQVANSSKLLCCVSSDQKRQLNFWLLSIDAPQDTMVFIPIPNSGSVAVHCDTDMREPWRAPPDYPLHPAYTQEILSDAAAVEARTPNCHALHASLRAYKPDTLYWTCRVQEGSFTYLVVPYSHDLVQGGRALFAPTQGGAGLVVHNGGVLRDAGALAPLAFRLPQTDFPFSSSVHVMVYPALPAGDVLLPLRR